MQRYLITFSYDGTNYAGYQLQPGLRTVQKELEDALTYINQHKKTTITSSGRTDAKVHALGQKAHFDLSVTITDAKLKRALNSNTSDEIHVSHVEKVDSNFHARFMVKSKEYKYLLNMGEYNPLERNYVYQYNHELDVKAMQKAIKYLKGTHDFRAFVSENKTKDNCIRCITCARIKRNKLDSSKLEFTFIGSGFMKYQVRNMVGYLIKIGEKKESPSKIKDVLESKNRLLAGKTAPAVGLYLMDVTYE